MISRQCKKLDGETVCCTCSMLAGFFVFIVLVLSIAVVVLRRVKRCNNGNLSEGRFDKTTQRNPRQRRAQCESNFRRHAHEETGFVSLRQAFYYNFVIPDGQCTS